MEKADEKDTAGKAKKTEGAGCVENVLLSATEECCVGFV